VGALLLLFFALLSSLALKTATVPSDMKIGLGFDADLAMGDGRTVQVRGQDGRKPLKSSRGLETRKRWKGAVTVVSEPWKGAVIISEPGKGRLLVGRWKVAVIIIERWKGALSTVSEVGRWKGRLILRSFLWMLYGCPAFLQPMACNRFH